MLVEKITSSVNNYLPSYSSLLNQRSPVTHFLLIDLLYIKDIKPLSVEHVANTSPNMSFTFYGIFIT